MLQIQFSKEGMANYMILSGETEWKAGYQSNLFQYHKVPCFLQYEIREMNGNTALYYRLQYRTTMQSVIGHLPFTLEKLKNMVTSIVEAMEMIEEYLLDLEGILWQTDKVFLEADTGRIQFCYYPKTEGNKGTLKEFLAEVIQAVNKKEEEAVLFILQFYNLITEPNCTLEDLRGFQREKIGENIRVLDMRYKQEGTVEFNQKGRKPEKDSEKKTVRDTLEEPEERVAGTGEWVVKIMLLVMTGINLLLIVGLLLHILNDSVMKYLFISLGALIILTILYMNLSKEETADEIMQDFFEKQEQKESKSVVDEKKVISDGKEMEKPPVRGEETWRGLSEVDEFGETTLLETRKTSEESREIVQEKQEVPLCLKALEQEQYPSIYIKNKSVVLGCMTEGCNYVLKAKGISRMHAKLMEKSDGTYLLDLNSTNGTYLNGELVKSGQDYKLEAGDMVAFAMSEFYVAEESVP